MGFYFPQPWRTVSRTHHRNYVTCMLQKCSSHLKDCGFIVAKKHTHTARCANIALCVDVFTFHIDNMTLFPSQQVTMPSLSRLFISHILWPAASSTKKSQALNLFSCVCLHLSPCAYSGIWTDIHELVCVCIQCQRGEQRYSACPF